MFVFTKKKEKNRYYYYYFQISQSPENHKVFVDTVLPLNALSFSSLFVTSQYGREYLFGRRVRSAVSRHKAGTGPVVAFLVIFGFKKKEHQRGAKQKEISQNKKKAPLEIN